ncbi:MAG: sugar phosphate isomerase/epimerase [Clostridia bacterium]|nr:sugar phosphate isomerase/epimerase [Clostridia bacterium]
MKKFKVGIQLYGVREAMERDFYGTLKALADMGYEYVEFAGYFGKSGEEIKKILDELSLKCVSVHQRLDFFDDEPEEKIAFLKAFGVKYVVVPWHDRSALAGGEGWADTVCDFNKKAKLLSENGMVLAYHNHDFEFEKHEGRYLHDYIFEAVTEGRIVPELDTCWVRYAGIAPEEKIREFSGKVEIVHLKDFTAKRLGGGPVYELIGKAQGASKEDNGFEFRPLGQGMQDFSKILTACEECGTEYVIVEQDKTYGGVTELEAAKISREYLKSAFNL